MNYEQYKNGAIITVHSRGPKGDDGRTPYFHTAWANSADGKVDFSITDSDKKRYIGTYTDYIITDSTDPTKYKWVDMVGSVEIGGRNLLNNTSSEWKELTLDAGQTITYLHPEVELKQDSTYTFTVEYETNNETIEVQVGTGLLGYEQDIVGWNAANIPSNQRVSLTHKVLESELIKGTNTDTISIDDNFYLDSAMIVTNQSNALYSANGMTNPPIGGVFNNIQRNGIIPANRRKIDFPPLHNTIIVLLDYYNMTKDLRYLDKAKLIANYILTLEFEANFAGQQITLVAGNNVWNGTTWVLGKSEIGLRIIYNAINVMTLMYEHTKDERYSTLAKKLMITTTTANGNVKNRISWDELGSYMRGASYDQIYVNPDNNNASFSWVKFNPNNADALVEAYHNYIRVFGDIEVTTVENNKIKPSVVVDDFAKWILAINARGELTMSPTGLPYIFYDYPAGGVNWDWVSGDNERGDVWFTGDASLWLIKGLSLLANDYPQIKQLAETYFNNLYNLKATSHPELGNLANQILFFDRYNFNGTHLDEDMDLSISSTALFWEVGLHLNLITPKLEHNLINTLKVNYPERTGNKDVDGAYSWNPIYPQDSLIEIKANGEIYHTLVAFYFAKSGNRNIFGYKITNRGPQSTIRYRRQQLEHGNIPTDWTPSQEDIQANIDKKANSEDLNETKEQVKKAVKTITEEYYQSTSATSQTGGDWTTVAPTWQEGKFIFIRSKITYVDGTTSYTTIVNITGAKGDKGDPGEQGPKGEKGDPGEVTLAQLGAVQSELTTHKEDYANLVTEVNNKANKQQEGWIAPTLLNGWVNGIIPVRYMKDTMGFVHIEGIVNAGTAGVIFNLPSGYRPSRSIFEVGMKDALATAQAIQLFEVRSMGDVRLYAESGNWNINFAFKVSYFVGAV